MCEFGECAGHTERRCDVGGEFVSAAAEVLHEGMAGVAYPHIQAGLVGGHTSPPEADEVTGQGLIASQTGLSALLQGVLPRP